MQEISGVWVPLITPFIDGEVDLQSYRRLVEYYVGKGVDGLIPLGTTGESPVLEEDEAERLLEETLEIAAGRLPVIAGIGGNATNKVIKTVKRLERLPFNGLLSVCPYYNRPTQQGLIAHFSAIADATSKHIVIYNIPYRTSVNLTNDTLFHLAELPNVIGIKDSSGIIQQSLELLSVRPEGFSVLTGEDAMFYTMLANGADGGILASCHIATERFVQIARLMAANDHREALAVWATLAPVMPLLFREANPIPIKYCLWREGLIASPECRLPLGRISDGLAAELDQWMGC